MAIQNGKRWYVLLCKQDFLIWMQHQWSNNYLMSIMSHIWQKALIQCPLLLFATYGYRCGFLQIKRSLFSVMCWRDQLSGCLLMKYYNHWAKCSNCASWPEIHRFTLDFWIEYLFLSPLTKPDITWSNLEKQTLTASFSVTSCISPKLASLLLPSQEVQILLEPFLLQV